MAAARRSRGLQIFAGEGIFSCARLSDRPTSLTPAPARAVLDGKKKRTRWREGVRGGRGRRPVGRTRARLAQRGKFLARERIKLERRVLRARAGADHGAA